MIEVRVPTRYDVPVGLDRPSAERMLMFAASGGQILQPVVKITDAYTNLDALYPQIGAEFRYNGTQLQGSQDEADFALFPCRNECKKTVGKSDPGFKQCITDCKAAKGNKKALSAKTAASDAQLSGALAQLSAGDSANKTAEPAPASKTGMWIIVIVLILAIVGVGIYMVKRKGATA